MRRKIDKMVRELSLVWKMCKNLPFRCVVRNTHFLETCTCVSCWMHDNGNVIHRVTEKEGNKDLKLLVHNNLLFLGKPQGYSAFAECSSMFSGSLRLPFCLITKGWGSYVLHRHNRYSCTFEACVSPAPNVSAVTQSFEDGDAIEIC